MWNHNKILIFIKGQNGILKIRVDSHGGTIPITLAHKRLIQQNHEFRASLNFIGTLGGGTNEQQSNKGKEETEKMSKKLK